MATATGLADLPIELLDRIVTRMSLQDTCMLRLVGRHVAAQVARTSHRAAFVDKRVSLSKDCLELFKTITEESQLGAELRHLTIVGLIAQDDQTPAELSKDTLASLLATALTSLRQRSSTNSLESLSLDVKVLSADGALLSTVDQHGSIVLDRAGYTANMVAHALKASNVSIRQLDMFSKTKRCALGLHEAPLLLSSLSTPLKSLSMALHLAGNQISDSGHWYFGNFAELLKDLEQLEIRWVQTAPISAKDTKLQERKAAHELLRTPMPVLTEVCLKGLQTTEQELLAFFTSHDDLRMVSLEEVNIGDGSFSSIFEFFDERMKLDSLYLNDLYEACLLQFKGVSGKSHFPHPRGPTWMKRTSQDRHQPIRYHRMTGRVKGSPASNRWAEQKRIWYSAVY